MREIRSLTSIRGLAVKPETYPALSGLRAVLAAWVVFLHASQTFHVVAGGWLQPLVDSGVRAVDTFFVLSGFVLFHNYQDVFATRISRRHYLDFLRNRLARLYPTHIVTLAICIALFAASVVFLHSRTDDFSTVSPPAIVANLLLVHAWYPALFSRNLPSWSISAEWFAYLLCPALIWAFRRLPAAALVALALVAVLVPDIWRHTLWHTELGPPSPPHMWSDIPSNLPLVRISRAFSLGAIGYVFVRRFGSCGRTSWLALASAGAIIANIYVFDHGSLPLHLVLSTALIVALASDSSIPGRILSSRPVVYLGEVSYSLYMCHWAVMLVILKLPLLGGVTKWGAAIIASQIAAALFYRWIEVPCRRAVKAFRFSRAAQAETGSGPSAPPERTVAARPH